MQALIRRARGKWDENLAALVTHAVEADPQNAYTLVVMGQTLNMMGRFAAADALFVRSWELSPDATPIRNRAENYIAWTGNVTAALGMIDAIPKPLDHGLVHQLRASILTQQGEIEAAISEHEQVRSGVEAIRAPTSGPQASRNNAILRAAQLETRQGHSARAAERFTEAAAALQKFTLDFPDQNAGLVGLAVAHALHGEKAEARATIDAAMRIVTATRDAAEISRTRQRKAEVLGLLGEVDAAVAELRALHEMGYGFGYRLRRELEWEPLRGDPKFQQLMKEAEARADAQPRPRQ
jgi:tetratricopeptide (TPR) repeat protein